MNITNFSEQEMEKISQNEFDEKVQLFVSELKSAIQKTNEANSSDIKPFRALEEENDSLEEAARDCLSYYYFTPNSK